MKTDKLPFHETIVNAILYASDINQIECLAKLIKETKIPKNHDTIITAWRKRLEELDRSDIDLGVCSNLLEQKQFHAKKCEEHLANHLANLPFRLYQPDLSKLNTTLPKKRSKNTKK